MFNSHSRLHHEEVSYLSSLYTRLILNFRLLIFNPPSNSSKGLQEDEYKNIVYMWYRNKTTDHEFHIPFREEKKSFLRIIMKLISLWE